METVEVSDGFHKITVLCSEEDSLKMKIMKNVSILIWILIFLSLSACSPSSSDYVNRTMQVRVECASWNLVEHTAPEHKSFFTIKSKDESEVIVARVEVGLNYTTEYSAVTKDGTKIIILEDYSLQDVSMTYSLREESEGQALSADVSCSIPTE